MKFGCQSSNLRRPIRRLRSLLTLLAMGAITASASADSNPSGAITSYGYAVFGELKYGADFTHFDYTNPDAPKGGSYRFAQTGNFDSINLISLLGTFPPSIMYLSDSLMKQSRDESASYYCLICKQVTWSKDLSWAEFELNPDAKFTDGKPITVEDVLFSYGLSEGLTLPSFSRVKQIVDHAEQTGPGRVRFTFNQTGNPTLLTVVGLMPVIPKHSFAGRDPFKPSLVKPVMAGPYRIGNVDPGRYLIFERDENYWAANHPINKGRYNFDTIRQDYYRDASLQNEAFISGNNDLRYETNAANMRQQEQLPAFLNGDIQRQELAYKNGAIYNSLTINSRVPFLSDRRVRKALVLAYDYEWMKRVILGGDYGRVGSNFANSDFAAEGLPNEGELDILNQYRGSLPDEVFTKKPWLPAGGDRAQMRANLLEARELLRDAGYRIADGKLVDPQQGEPVTLDLLAYSPLLMTQSASFIHNMAKLGIDVNFRAVDSSQLRHLMRNYDYELLLYPAAFAPLSTPGVGMKLIWTTEAANKPNLLNYAGVREPVIDDAMERMVTATNRQTVVDTMRVVDRVARWQFYSIPLYHRYPTQVGRLPITFWNKFGRPDIEPTYNFPFWTADSWWYDPEKAAQLSHGAK